MTTDEKVESLLEQAGELPDDAQAELFQSLAEMRSNHLGIDIDAQQMDALPA